MRPFGYQRVADIEAAIAATTARKASSVSPVQAPAQFIAGGTNLTDYMKLGVMRPELLVDINPLSRDALGRIEVSAQGIRFGSLVRMAEAQSHPVVRRDFPVIAETLALAASQQIRNMASLGGNILQRTRCEYFREPSWRCNKRAPGSGCAALDGINREHAILGVSDHCIATYHGDLAQALIALDAKVETRGPKGGRTIRFADLHREPCDTPHIETVLEPDELITFITVQAAPHTRRSHFVKLRDRDSYQFALASAAVAMDLQGGRVRDVRIALGGVATVPWRGRTAEEALRGRKLTGTAARAAADAAFEGARLREHNAFKLAAGKNTLVRALMETGAMKV